MKRTYKYRVYPTCDQERWLYAEFKHEKKLYNYMLQMRSQMYNYGSISVSRIDQINHLAKLRENNTYYSDHSQDMQVSTIKRLDAAYDNFFGRCKDPTERKKGHPKFKGSVRSVTWCLRKHKLKTGERVRQNPMPAHHTSQICSACCQKSPIKLKLSERVFHCKFCGLKLDRDHNAALNILHRAETCALRGEVWDAIPL